MQVHVTECDAVIANALNERTGYSITAEQWYDWQNGEDDSEVEAAVQALLGGWESEDVVGDVLRELDIQITF